MPPSRTDEPIRMPHRYPELYMRGVLRQRILEVCAGARDELALLGLTDHLIRGHYTAERMAELVIDVLLGVEEGTRRHCRIPYSVLRFVDDHERATKDAKRIGARQRRAQAEILDVYIEGVEL